MFSKLIDTVFGCWHPRYSFPITVARGVRRKATAAAVTGTYVVCLDCGREFPYDWAEMRVVSPEDRNRVGAFVTEEAA